MVLSYVILFFKFLVDVLQNKTDVDVPLPRKHLLSLSE